MAEVTSLTRTCHPDLLKYREGLTPQEMGLTESKGKYYTSSDPATCKFAGKEEPRASGRRQYVWQSEGTVNNDDVRQLFDHLITKGQAVHINTGTHGDEEGKTVNDAQNKAYADSGFLHHDILLTLKQPNASFQIITTESQETRPVGANHIIDAWCMSAQKTALVVKREAEAKHSLGGGNTTVVGAKNVGMVVSGGVVQAPVTQTFN